MPPSAKSVAGGALLAVVLVPVLGFLAVAGVVLWMYGVALPGHQREITEWETENSRRMAATAQQTLTTAAADGRLTDEEISEAAAGTAWDLQRTDPVWVLRTDFGSSGPNCFSFDITTPLGPATRVTTTEFSTCPLVKPRTS